MKNTKEVISARIQLKNCRRIVVKVGSALLADKTPDPFECIATQIAQLRGAGHEVVLVSSGAIALGLKPLGFSTRPKALSELQAAAATGQSVLMAHWSEVFSRLKLQVAQILLTHADMRDRERYLNARNALLKLLELGIVPVINENDTVSVREIKFGDNDELAAHIAGLVDADLVVLMTQTNGLFTADPLLDPTAQRISVVKNVSKEIERCAGGAAALGTGGMNSKVKAVRSAARHGAATLIIPGREPGSLVRSVAGEDVGTLFCAPGSGTESAKKRWIALTLRSLGKIIIDEGAARAIRNQASLLFVGVQSVEGSFQPGDAVDIAVGDAAPFARGLVAISSADLRRIAGKKSTEAERILGCPVPDEAVNRDNLVFL